MVPAGPSPDQVGRFRADLERLIGTPAGRLGIAFSGGPDSSALLLLAAGTFPGSIEAATVDHGLRPDSAAEARLAAGLCERLAIPHRVLRPSSPIAGNLQSAAREARYSLLEGWCEERGLDWLLTAHHADDQAETLLMRLNRGAGLAGLSSIRAVNGRRVRPLLGWRRSELVEIVRAGGIETVDDPSNRDQRFDRARLRLALEQAEWIDRDGLARSAAALDEADRAVEWVTDGLWAERVTVDGVGLVLDPAGLPGELRRRLVRRALARLDPAAAPRGEPLSRLLATLEEGGAATLAGVKAEGGESWRFEPAPSRRS